MVSVLTFYSDNQSSIPAEAYQFFSRSFVFEKSENKQKEAGGGRLNFSLCHLLATGLCYSFTNLYCKLCPELFQVSSFSAFSFSSWAQTFTNSYSTILPLFA